MAKPLVFRLGASEFALEMNKVDRAKLYGYKDVEILDDSGQRCEMATLAEDGHTIIARGGTGMGYLSADGNWCDKSQLKPVDLSGQAITPVTSSFQAPIDLAEPTTMEDYLEHTIRSVYVMEGSVAPELIEKLKSGAIYKFAYSYRGGIEADVAFLLTNDADELFMAVGSSTELEYVGLQNVADSVEEEEDTPERTATIWTLE